MDRHYKQDFFWGALVGGAVATLSTLLFTTKKGKQLQRQIADFYHEVEEKTEDVISQSKEKVGKGIDYVEKKASEGKEKAGELLDHVEKKMSNAAKDAKSKAEDTADHVKKHVAHATDDSKHK